MPLNIRTYHELTEADRSGLGAQVGAQRRRVAERLASVQRIVAVMSGKGGVGKSFVTAGLARALARAGRRVGALDADLNGPTLARLLEARGPLAVTAGAVEPVAGADGVRCVSMAHLLEDGKPLAFKGPESDAFIWRGALEAAALRELLGDVAWGALDVLLVDLPPGIGRFHELADLLPAPPDVLTVTIPTIESAEAVRRALTAARDRGARLVGVIENMSGGAFAGDAGDVLAREFALPLLARIPFGPGDAVWQALGERL
ncbi:MAG TPA: P-loop NTPase [Gemmatimonadales bacterium]|nr:P-loop NTPase [Gemmatimonadales bacterium]